MSTQMNGSVKMAGEVGRSVQVRIHLDEGTLTLAAEGGGEIGTWSMEQVGIASKPDGFHLRIEGEEVVLTTSDDARFALALGISTPTNRLARQMAKLRDEAAAANLVVDLTDSREAEVLPPPNPEKSPSSRRANRLSDGLSNLGPLVVAAAVIAFLAGIVAATGGAAISFPGNIPAWPAMLAVSLVLAAGGVSAFQDPHQGRLAIGGAIALGLLIILLSAGRIEDVGLVSEALLAFTLAIVGCGVLLAIDTAGRNTFD